jgi:hypothetical protein
MITTAGVCSASTSSMVTVSTVVIWPVAKVVMVLMGDLAFLSRVGLDLLARLVLTHRSGRFRLIC